jgi:hypothetical protein
MEGACQSMTRRQEASGQVLKAHTKASRPGGTVAPVVCTGGSNLMHSWDRSACSQWVTDENRVQHKTRWSGHRIHCHMPPMSHNMPCLPKRTPHV